MLLGSIGNPKNHLSDTCKSAERNRNIYSGLTTLSKQDNQTRVFCVITKVIFTDEKTSLRIS